MKTGETVKDGQGRTWSIGTMLGRGTWSRSWVARLDGESRDHVLKVPLTAADLGEDRHLAAACAAIAEEQASLHSHSSTALLALVDRFPLPDGRTVLVLPKAASTLERRLAAGISLQEQLETALRVIQALRELLPLASVHGNLKATNVLLGERGEVRLGDPLTPTLRRHHGPLLRLMADPAAFLPPEARDGGAAEGPVRDSYALAMLLYRGAMRHPERPEQPLPQDGLDKGRLVALKDRVHNRLQDEHANPRFHSRLADRAAAVLNRALSREASPSPPYRFTRLDELQTRLTEVVALVHPAVTHVGRLLLDRSPGHGWYTTSEEVAFSATVACTAGVETHEEIACGLAVFDAETNERCKELPCAYTVDRHPSGRFRFGFRLGSLTPGAWRVRVAFTIRDSGLEPVTAEGTFEVRAAPGYVPPVRAPEPVAIPLHRAPENDEPTQVREPHRAEPASLAPTPVLPIEAEEPARLVASGGGEAVRFPPMRAPEQTDSGALSARSLEPSLPPSSPAGRPILSLPPIEMPRRTPPAAAPTPPPPSVQASPPPVRAPAASPPRPTLREVASPPDTFGATARVAPVGSSPVGNSPLGVSPVRVEAEDSFEPEYKGAGRWSELPLPDVRFDEGGDPRRGSEDPDPDSELELPPTGPVGQALGQLLDMVKGDAFVLFIGGAALVIVVLILALILLS